MAEYVLIKDGRVENIIIADESFLEIIKENYDAILDHDSFPEIAHIGGVAEQLEDGSWVIGSNAISYAPGQSDFIDVEEVPPAIEAPVIEEA